MLKLMKYELRKQLISKILLFGLLLFIEITFLLGILIRNEDMIKVTHGLLEIIFIFGMIFMLIEPVMALYSDLGKKQGYLLFMTPNSAKSIVGAKVAMGLLQILILFSFVVGLTSINDLSISWYFNKDINTLSNTFNAFNDAGFSFRELVATFFMLAMISVDFITLAFLAISISYSFISIGKLNSFLSIILFFLLFLIETLVVGVLFIAPTGSFLNATNGLIIISLLVCILPAIGNFLGAVLLIERRISL